MRSGMWPGTSVFLRIVGPLRFCRHHLSPLHRCRNEPWIYGLGRIQKMATHPLPQRRVVHVQLLWLRQTQLRPPLRLRCRLHMHPPQHALSSHQQQQPHPPSPMHHGVLQQHGPGRTTSNKTPGGQQPSGTQQPGALTTGVTTLGNIRAGILRTTMARDVLRSLPSPSTPHRGTGEQRKLPLLIKVPATLCRHHWVLEHLACEHTMRKELGKQQRFCAAPSVLSSITLGYEPTNQELKAFEDARAAGQKYYPQQVTPTDPPTDHEPGATG